jgi:hypothetical protein
MPILSKRPVTLPEGDDHVAYSLHIFPKFTAKGVTASLTLTAQHYRANADGSNPVKVGEQAQKQIADVFVEAATDPAFAELVGQMQSMVQSYVNAKDL